LEPVDADRTASVGVRCDLAAGGDFRRV